MNIAFIGTGYVGLVSGTCFAELGQNVTCIDKDSEKIEKLRNGEIPIFEPGLKELVEKNVSTDRLRFTDSLEEGIRDAEVIFIAVGTPTDSSTGNADLSYIFAAAEELAEYVKSDAVIVTKSTVPVGTGEHVAKIISAKSNNGNVNVVSNPEFLREGCAVNDFLYPDRIIVGIQSQPAQRKMELLYKPLTTRGVNILFTDIQTAELTKYAANAFLATKIAFINEIADMCEKSGANVTDVAKGMGMDHRIGETYLSPGPGYGGSCFPKDTLALRYMADQWQSGEKIVSSVVASNDLRKQRAAEKIINALDGGVNNQRIAVLGLAFKANTDDMRESSAIPIIEHLQKAGAKIAAYDPEAMQESRQHLNNIEYCNDSYSALKDAVAGVIITEWSEFSSLDFEKVLEIMRNPLIVDFRNLYNPDRMLERGVDYISVGRKDIQMKTDSLTAASQ